MIGIGANLHSRDCGAPISTCNAALEALGRMEVRVVRRSRWYWSVPVPVSDQPPFVNGVAEVITGYDPKMLLLMMHAVEAEFGRRRGVTNAARVLDLDLLTYNDEITGPDADVWLPHPQMHERAFVLRPFFELAPHWNHPVVGLNVMELLARIPSGQVAEPIECESLNGATV